MAKSKSVIANMTIERGTSLKPDTIAKGDKFDIDADDPENLIGRGIVSDASAPVEPPAEGASVKPSTGSTVTQQ